MGIKYNMSTKTISVTVNAEDHAKVKKLINVSELCSNAIRMAAGSTIKDVDESQLQFKCWMCGKMATEGFKCELTKKTHCLACDKTYNWHICDYRDHSHFRIPFNAERDKEILEELEIKQ